MENANKCWEKVAKDPSGKKINALAQHIQNLLTPSTPHFFNTLYDPYREGADFVRGYPFSLRGGAPTAISHGLWLNIPDYDAPTQLVKPLERNTRFLFLLTLFTISFWPFMGLHTQLSLSLSLCFIFLLLVIKFAHGTLYILFPCIWYSVMLFCICLSSILFNWQCISKFSFV